CVTGAWTEERFGRVHGRGLEGTAGFMQSPGYRPGKRYAALGGLAEAGGGALFLLGFLTPLAAVAIIGMMLNAILSVHLDNGVWSTNGGYEFPLVMAAVATAVALAGPGSISVDAAVGLDRL